MVPTASTTTTHIHALKIPITVYEFVPRPGHAKTRFIWCREGKVYTAGPDVPDLEWALSLYDEATIQLQPGRTAMRPIDIKLDVHDKQRKLG